ncbi:MAG: hypothetical protein MMC33_007502 [Icmadophila ericetorum]|nr:hypothetical protein [Icmadophila ericetorum]
MLKADTLPRILAPLAPSSADNTPSPTTILQTSSILTNKEWTIPPRPKPGRKPATDTPPTKRKAQNRAAQRAFRERRAAKVGELEEQMKLIEEEDQKEQEELREQIRRLEQDVADYRSSIVKYAERLRAMEDELRQERQMREEAQRNTQILHGYQSRSMDAVPLPPRNTGTQIKPATSWQGHTEETQYIIPDDTMPIGCGKCTINSDCECIEQAIEMASMDNNDMMNGAHKRPASPIDRESTKRLRGNHSLEVKHEHRELEMDFTTKSSTVAPRPSVSANSLIESCGFCQEGTACLCAELAADNPSNREIDSRAAQTLSQMSESQRATYAKGSYSQTNSREHPCINGPGTCNQCQSDPNSTLFCKTLAATQQTTGSSQQANIVQSCGKGSQCCRLPPTPSSSTYPTQSASYTPDVHQHVTTGLTISCADAFTTLSRHPAFDQASSQLGTWLPQLSTVPKAVEGRTAFEIEAASVMGVLRLFDRRFGKDGRGPGE